MPLFIERVFTLCCSIIQPVFGLGMDCLENKNGISGVACESNSRSEPVLPHKK